MNWIDKTIGYFSPESGLKRQVARAKLQVFNSGYGSHGASYARKSLVSWMTSGRNADDDIVDNIETLRNRSRDLYMGSPLAAGALKTLRTNIVGSGLMLNAQVDADFLHLTEEQAKEWENSVEREWRLWADTIQCDAERKLTFYQLQSLVLLSALMSGDVFVTLPVIKRAGSVYDLRISLIEADRVCNPNRQDIVPGKNVVGGVEVDGYGAAKAYYIAKYNPDSRARSADWKQEWVRVLAFGEKSGRRNVLHVMCDTERPSQRRGVPLLAPVIEALKQLTRYGDAELMAAVVAGMFTVFIKSNSPQTPLGQMFPPDGPGSADPASYELGNGAIVALEDGESVEVANPTRPSSTFEGFVQAVCRQIGAALEIPYELLVKNFTASYSASRASLLEAWKMFRMRREWLISAFCQPIYEEWLTEAVAKGRVKAPGFFDDPAIRAAWCGADWFGDAQGQLDPLKEANAAKVRVDEGFSTREREAAELTGMKFETIHAARKREEAMRRADGLSGVAAQAPSTSEEEESEE